MHKIHISDPAWRTTFPHVVAPLPNEWIAGVLLRCGANFVSVLGLSTSLTIRLWSGSMRTVFVNSSGKLRTHLAHNHHQRIQKTGEIGLTEILTLAFRLTLPSQIVPRCGENGPSIPL
jgi:hypothetical protein